jgi:hypothetical protein
VVNPINQAILNLKKRAENLSRAELVETFVDIGPIFTLLANAEHQILYGRRGTGKTHVLSYLGEQVSKNGHCVIVIDMRTIGSTGGLYSDSSIRLSERATRLLVDALSVIHERILEYAIENDKRIDLSKLGPILDVFARAITEVQVIGTAEAETLSDVERSTESGASVTVGIRKLESKISGKDAVSEKVQDRHLKQGIEKQWIHLPTLQSAIIETAKIIAPYKIWILIDEWAEVPYDLQPFLADMLRRTILPVNGVVVKIAAIEQRSNFRVFPFPESYIGVEVGADIPTSLTLDEFMVFDNNEERAREFFKNLVFKHIKPLLPVEGETTLINKPDDLISAIFTQMGVFDEFVRAAEGVPRDAINILVAATLKAGDKRISIPNIRDSARNWYNRDKEKAIHANLEASRLLRWIIDEVIGQRHARAFLLRNDRHHKLIDFLFDARILHIIKQNVASKDQPGIRFNVYSIDYGSYVDLINTSREPHCLFEAETEEGLKLIQVPLNDYRAIRRAVLDLDAYAKMIENQQPSNVKV